MADGLTTQSATLATVPTSSKISTVDTGTRGHVQAVFIGGAETPTQTSVAASATNVNLLALNTARVGATLYNDSTSFVNVKLGTTASATSFTIRMGPGGYMELPYNYNGNVDAIWDTANGSMRITEFT